MKKARKQPFAEFRLDCMAVSSRIPEYDGLHDTNLAGYFASKQKRKLLIKQNLISKEGAILESGSKHRLDHHFPPIRQRKDPFSAESRPRKSKSTKHQPLSKEKLKDLIAKMRKVPKE